MKLPSFQFYPGDWMKDPAVRSLTPAARGIWIDMLCLMFESPRRGHLENSQGKPVSPEKLARMLGVPAKQLQGLLEELEEEGVFSRTDEGTIFCRRMVRDEAFRSARAQCGKLGGNPSLRAKPLLNQEDKLKDKVEGGETIIARTK